MVRPLSSLLSALALALIVAGCSNPAADKPAAVVSDPAPAPEPTATESATPDAPTDAEPATTATPTSGLAFDGSGSSIGYVGSKIVGGSHEGGFKTFHGSFTLTPDGKDLAAVEATIDTKSIYSDNDKLTEHLKSKDFFEVDTYPESKFVSTAIGSPSEGVATRPVTGSFTLHGVTKSIEFPATIDVKDGEVSLSSEFSIKRADFGIVFGNVGDNAIRDEVLIKLSLKSAKADPASLAVE